MDVNTAVNALAVKNYDSASSTGKTGKTGKHEAHQAPNYAPKNKEEGAQTPEDTLDISEEAAKKSDSVKEKNKGHWKNFDMDAFQTGIRNTLMQSINQSKDALKAAGVEFAKYNSDSVLYDLSGMKDVEESKVPDYWNAENTSQRIVDFAMSFRGLATELSDEEYIEQVRAAVEKGYKLAKKDLGDLPGPTAKLFNNTYNLTMSKFDELLEKARKGAAE
ncbi:MAG: DUF5610 domain-containing protein [Fibromonadaceae bacterium]|jgi:hypothetical protein|nr:DUF5610 domain-containing protein [Fibromonadaceae bacterium]